MNAGVAALVIALVLATAAVVAAFAGAAGISVFLGLVTVPAGLYAALAARSIGVVVALGTAVVGAAVIVFWAYTLVSAISGS